MGQLISLCVPPSREFIRLFLVPRRRLFGHCRAAPERDVDFLATMRRQLGRIPPQPVRNCPILSWNKKLTTRAAVMVSRPPQVANSSRSQTPPTPKALQGQHIHENVRKFQE